MAILLQINPKNADQTFALRKAFKQNSYSPCRDPSFLRELVLSKGAAVKKDGEGFFFLSSKFHIPSCSFPLFRNNLCFDTDDVPFSPQGAKAWLGLLSAVESIQTRVGCLLFGPLIKYDKANKASKAPVVPTWVNLVAETASGKVGLVCEGTWVRGCSFTNTHLGTTPSRSQRPRLLPLVSQDPSSRSSRRSPGFPPTWLD
jgi:hypothetical protein